MGTTGKIGVLGMKTAGNRLTAPPGSLTEASNAVIPSRAMLTQRRGFMLQSEYASSSNGYIDGDNTDANTNRAKELYQWGTTLMVHYSGSGGGKLASFANFITSPSRALVGSYTEPDSTTMRMKFAQLAKSLYWTTDAGLYTLDVVGATARAGGYRRPTIFFADGVSTYSGLSGNPNATGSWYAKDNAVAYRATYGHVDANHVVHESEASGRLIIVNPKDVVVVTGSLVRTSNVNTATVTAHKFRVGDILNLSSSDTGAFNQNNNVVTAVTATTIVWAETAANHNSAVDITLTSGTKSVQVTVGANGGSFTAGDFVRIYRTDESGGEAIDPGDECFLAYERTVTSTDASNGYVTITDTTPSGFLGDPLDSNSNSGEGELGINTRPPICRDLCVWDGRLWGGQTTDVHRLRIRLLGIGSPNGLQSADLIAINTRVFIAGTDFNLYSAYLPTVNVERTTYDMATYMPGSSVGLTAHQEHDGETGLGEVVFEQATLASTMADGASGAIGAIYAATSRASAFGDALAATKAVTQANTSRTGSTVTVRCTAHGFAQGQVVMLARSVGSATDANFPLGLKTVASVVDANNFTYTESGSAVTLAIGSVYYAYATIYKSDNNTQGVRYSRQGIPEAWPVAFSLGGLPDGAEVLRVAPSGSGYSLLVFLKDSSIYRVSGEYPYTVRRLDDTASLIGADTLAPHSGELHALTTQGLCAITEAGVRLLGPDIEDITRSIVNDIQKGSISAQTLFATSYESERQFLLSMQLHDPDNPATLLTTYVGQALAYQSMLQSFTRDFWHATCGIVWRGRDFLVWGDHDNNQIRVERKALDYTDYSDERSVVNTLASDATGSATSASITTSSSVSGAAVGSVVYNSTRNARALCTTISGAPTYTLVGNATAFSAWKSGDAIYFYRPYQMGVTFAPDAGGAPGVEKRWREVQLHFGRFSMYQFTAIFGNEKSSSSAGLVTVTSDSFVVGTVNGGTRLVRVEVPEDYQMCSTLTVALLFGEAACPVELLGMSASWEPVSEKSGR